MNSRRAPAHPARWPFWLLLAAWVCANAPAIAVCALLAWLGEARHFSHQQRLMTEVACVLAGQETPGVLDAVKDLPPAPPPALPAEIEFKKLDLALERTVEVWHPAMPDKDFPPTVIALNGAWRAAPPHEPPRMGAIG